MLLGDELVQRGRRGIGDRRHPGPAQPTAGAGLHRDHGEDLLAPRATPGQAGLQPADVGLVDLDHAGQPLPVGTDQHRAQPVQHRPRRLIRADLQRALQAQRRDPALVAGERPAGGEPHRQRGAGPVEDRPGRGRGPGPAAGALEPAITQPPALVVATGRAAEPGRPAQPLQVVQAVRVGGEPGPELAHRPRVVHPCPRPSHKIKLLRLSG